MSAAERTYRLLLLAYPAAFRAEYGREMVLAFRDQRRSLGDTGIYFWLGTIWDVVRSAPAQRADEWRMQLNTNIHWEGGPMKPMAIVAILIGAFDVVGSATEGWAGGIVNHDGTSLLAGMLGVLAGAMLIMAGVALFRGARRGLAGGGAVACLALFLVLSLATPRMGIAAIALGIGFPILLLLVLFWTRGGKLSAPRPV